MIKVNMMLSMTGYGKSEVTSGNKKYTVEIRSLNGKSSDISVKSQFLPKDIELEYRQYLTRRLVRGNIDVYLTSETVSGSDARRIDGDVFRDYFRQMSEIVSSLELDCREDFMSSVLVSSVLRMPDVVSADKDEMTEEELYHNIKQYDTEDDWTYWCDDEELRGNIRYFLERNHFFHQKFEQYHIKTYDVSHHREEVLETICSNCK